MVSIDGRSLSVDTVEAIALGTDEVFLAPTAVKRMQQSRAHVDKAVGSPKLIYSINTGLGALSGVRIPVDKLEELQVNFIRSHACNVGEPMPESDVRAMLLLRANALARGYSGVRVELAEQLLKLLNARVQPVIPRRGSVGASGDLSPLAHIGACLIGEGEAFYRGERMPGAAALKKAGLKPFQLSYKEGLSLINGTQQMSAIGCLLLRRAERLADIADLVCAASLEGVMGTSRAFESWLHESRPHAGQIASAKRLSAFLQDSEIFRSHIDCDRVQDPYSLRCAPQVHGACRDLLSFARNTLSVEINSSTDNPLVNPDTGEILSGGNFHGQPLAFALDIVGMAVSELGAIAERRCVKLNFPHFSGLPAFLVPAEGFNSGFMIAQYTAAHLAVENRVYAHPASTDSLPTSNEKEDHNSMGPIAAEKLRRVLENVEYILAIEALMACQALEFRKPLKPGKGVRVLYDFVRAKIPPVDGDRYLHPDIEWLATQIRSGELTRKVENHES